MKKLTLVIIVLLLLTTGLFSCSESKERAQLQEIEKMMDGNPNADSAMMLLQKIDTRVLSSEGDRAYYALLMTQAKEKNFEEVTDDSLISIAVKYYSCSNDTHYNMLSQYYLGCIKFNTEDYPQSIVAMFKSEECAMELDDKFWMGMIYRVLSDIYSETFNTAEELIYAEKECQYFKECGKQPYVNYALLDLARALNNQNEYEKSISLLKQCADSALKYNDDNLFVESKRLVGQCRLAQERYSDALVVYQSVNATDFASAVDSAYLCMAHIGCGNIEEAVSIFNKLSECTEPFYSLLKSELYAKQDSIEKAFQSFRISEEAATKELRERMGMNITNSAIDYLRLSKEAEKARSEKVQALLWLMSISTFLILAIIAILIYFYRKKQLSRIEQNVIAAEQLRESLTEKELQYAEARNSVKDLLSSKYEIFDELCLLVYESNNITTVRKRISDAVTSLIKQIQSDSSIIKSMEKLIDKHYSNLMTDLRTDLPDLPDAYYKLFLFSVLGFSATTISMLLEREKTSQVYNMRRHLKDKIKSLEEYKKAKYLPFL